MGNRKLRAVVKDTDKPAQSGQMNQLESALEKITRLESEILQTISVLKEKYISSNA